MKPGTVAFVNPNQPPSALCVIKECARDIGCQAYTVPSLDNYNWSDFPPNELGLFKEVHAENASLALQLARFFLTRAPPTGESNTPILDSCKAFQLEWREAVGLRLVNWPGRSQTVKQGSKLFFLDGAHTEQSMWACRKWFLSLLEKYPISEESTKRILIFNSTGDRNAEILLSPLLTLPFDKVIFCTNETREIDLASDNTNLNFSFDYAMRKCQINQVTWEAMQKKLIEAKGGRESVGDELSSHVMPHIEDALNFIDVLSQGCQSTQVFVTGSLHLIGGVLSFIHPDCYEKNPEDLQYESQIIDKYSKLSQ